jgi:hypothetical protein
MHRGTVTQSSYQIRSIRTNTVSEHNNTSADRSVLGDSSVEDKEHRVTPRRGHLQLFERCGCKYLIIDGGT